MFKWLDNFFARLLDIDCCPHMPDDDMSYHPIDDDSVL